MPYSPKRWPKLPPAAASQVPQIAASALRRPNVPVARRRLCNAIVDGQQRRTRSKARDAHVVSGPIHFLLAHFCHCSKDSMMICFLLWMKIAGSECLVETSQCADIFQKKSGARPAGACTCERAATENKAVNGATCSCGKRAASTFLFLSSILAVVQFCFTAVANGFFRMRTDNPISILRNEAHLMHLM